MKAAQNKVRDEKGAGQAGRKAAGLAEPSSKAKPSAPAAPAALLLEDRDDPAAFFRKKGFQVGTPVCRKGNSAVVYVIKAVKRSPTGGPGTAPVLDLEPHLGHAQGEPPVLGLAWEAFSSDYLLASAAALGEVVLADGWPGAAADQKAHVMSQEGLRGYVLQCVREVSRAAAHAAPYRGVVEPRTAPVKGVFVTRAVSDQGGLQIPPETTVVGYVEEAKAAEKEAEGHVLPGVAVRVLKAPVDYPPGRVHLVGKNSKEFQGVFFHVKPTAVPGEANMDLEYLTVSSVAVVEREHSPGSAGAAPPGAPLASASGAPQAAKAAPTVAVAGPTGFPAKSPSKAKSPPPAKSKAGASAPVSSEAAAGTDVPGRAAPPPGAGQPLGTAYKVAIPVLVNKRPLQEGEELRYWEAPQKKSKAAPKPKAIDTRSLLLG